MLNEPKKWCLIKKNSRDSDLRLAYTPVDHS